jgi:hypothetical protein
MRPVHPERSVHPERRRSRSRRARLKVSALALCLLSSCAFHVVRPKLDAVKRIALVQYVINPHLTMGYTVSDNAKVIPATSDIEVFSRMLSERFQVMAPFEVVSNPDYQALGKDKVDGWYTAAGMRIVDDRHLKQGHIDREVAIRLCAALKVDAVVAITNSWGEGLAGVFQATARNIYALSAYDTDGEKIWSDTVYGLSQHTFGTPPGGVISDDASWAQLQGEAFAGAVDQFKRHLER